MNVKLVFVYAVVVIAVVLSVLNYDRIKQLLSDGGETPEVATLEESRPETLPEPGMLPEAGIVADPARSIEERAAIQREPVPPEVELALLEKEQELLEMAEEYETVRSDRDLRQDQLDAMEGKLAEYSDAVLPLVLQKMDEANEARQTAEPPPVINP